MAEITDLLVTPVENNPDRQKVQVEFSNGEAEPFPYEVFDMSMVEGQSAYVRQRLGLLGFHLDTGTPTEQSQAIKGWIIGQLSL